MCVCVCVCWKPVYRCTANVSYVVHTSGVCISLATHLFYSPHCLKGSAGVMRNGTVIGDPLFTVPLLLVGDDTPELSGLSLCYEIHGQPNRYFNFISDTCTSVNALYSPMINPSDGNIVSKVGIVAVNSTSGRCVEVAVDLEGCSTSVNGETVEKSWNQGGITIFRHRNRVRIGVPNCDNVHLIMWVICQNISGQPMIKFIVSRDDNLKPTSHGLLGKGTCLGWHSL